MSDDAPENDKDTPPADQPQGRPAAPRNRPERSRRKKEVLGSASIWSRHPCAVSRTQRGGAP